MTIKFIFTLDTIVAGLFGLGLLVFPNELISIFDINNSVTSSQLLLAQLLGASLVGIGATEWLARNSARSEALPLLRGILWFDILAVIISLQATLSHTANAFGFLIVGLFLFFGIARIILGYGE